ncbi:MAG: sulfite exporter TauE/SafE family protein, partial [Promethearchaeota archaeon]
VYEKSATAIVSFSESIVSIVGILTFFLITFAGVNVDLILLPSIFTGGFLAALSAPYLVRIIPNKIWKYFIPLYAFGIGIYLLLQILV